MKVPRGRLLSSLSGGLGLVALALPASAAGARDRRQGRPADPGVAVQLGGRDRAGGLLRRAVDAVAAARSCRSSTENGCSGWPRLLEWLASLVGVALFALVLYSGFAGAQVPNANFSVTFIYVIFWVGMPLAERAVRRRLPRLQPVADLRAGAPRAERGARAGRRSRGPLLRYPRWLGVWPSVGVIVGFAWLELVYIPVDREHPSHAGGAVARVLPRDAGRDGVVRRRGVGRAGGRIRRLLQPALAAVGAVPGRGGRTCICGGLLSGVTDLQIRPGHGRPDLHDHRHDHVRRVQQRRSLAQHRAEPAATVRRSRLLPDAGARARLLGRAAVLHRADQRRSTGSASRACAASAQRYDTPSADRRVRAHARPDRVRLRARPLLLAAALARSRRSATWPRTRSATARTCSARAAIRSTIR